MSGSLSFSTLFWLVVPMALVVVLSLISFLIQRK